MTKRTLYCIFKPLDSSIQVNSRYFFNDMTILNFISHKILKFVTNTKSQANLSAERATCIIFRPIDQLKRA